MFIFIFVFCFRLGKELGVDPNVILETSHGRRSIDVLQLYDPSKANWECKLLLFSFLTVPVCINVRRMGLEHYGR